MEDFKFQYLQIVYKIENQKKGKVVKREKVEGKNFYNVNFGNCVVEWLEESKLCDKSLSSQLFSNACNNTPTLTPTNVLFEKEYDCQWQSVVEEKDTDSNSITISIMTGIEAVTRMNELKEIINRLEDDFNKVNYTFTKFIIRKEILNIQSEHDNISKQLEQVKISHVREGEHHKF